MWLNTPGVWLVFEEEFLSSPQQVEDRGLGRSREMNEGPKVRQRLGSTGESKGHHGFCQPASLPWILVTVSNFCLSNPAPTLCAWLELFKKRQHLSRLPECKLGTIFL